MALTLCTSSAIPGDADFDWWCSVGPVHAATPDPDRTLPGLTAALESAVDAQMETWWDLARRLGEQPSALLSHAPQCATNASDLGLMLGWRHLAESWMAGDNRILLICDDPWLFRELAAMGADTHGKPPGLWLDETKRAVRGLLARAKVALRVTVEALKYRSARRRFLKNAPVLLVYGHPASSSDGTDGYFGNLMQIEEPLLRVLHVDCLGNRAATLVDNKRTFSLHAWGSPLKALSLPFVRWRPNRAHLTERFGWLVRRASALEGCTGQAAMIRWQQICQRAWLEKTHPHAVAWPWENHGWERDFVRRAKSFGIRTIGYQHSTVGRREWNYAIRSNVDGAASIPARVCATGQAGISALANMGHDVSALTDIGALRAKTFKRLAHDPKGPVFVAVPFDAAIGNQMLAAVRPLAGENRKFIIKVHPMTPLEFQETPGVTRTNVALEDQPGVSAVLYAATTVGLEALLGGLPTLRFRPDGLIPTDPTPDSIDVPTASADTLEHQLQNLVPPASIDPESVFSPPNLALWQKMFAR